MHYVMDKGFYSEKGIGSLLKQRIKFVVGVPFTSAIAKNAVREFKDDITNPSNAIEVNGQLLYAKTKMVKMNERRAYIHVYFDEKRHTTERTVFMQKLIKLEKELRNGEIDKDSKEVKKYFTVRNSKNGLHIHRNEEVIREKTELSGFFVILTNDSKDAEYNLDIYRTKDVVEKSFDNLKNDLDLERLNVQSDLAMEGRIFIGFIGLIFASYIRGVMKQKGLYGKYTFTSLLLELKKLKRIHFSNGKKLLTEFTRKQKEIYKEFDMELPNSSSI
jgi:transposase